MSKYIFITTEGYTYQPNSTSPEPDIENMQVLGFGEGYSVKDVFANFIRKNKYLNETNFNEIIGLELKDGEQETFMLKESQ